MLRRDPGTQSGFPHMLAAFFKPVSIVIIFPLMITVQISAYNEDGVKAVQSFNFPLY